MKQKIEKTKTFIKEHKKEILIGTGVVMVSGLIFIVTKKKPKFEGARRVIKTSMGYKDLEKPSLNIGRIDELWQDEFGKIAIVNDFKVADMGAIGQEFLKIDGVTNETEVSVIMGLLDKQN